MKTSFFNSYRNQPNGVSISVKAPSWFMGKRYKELMPPLWLVGKYHDGKVNEANYREIYYEKVLDKLDVEEVYQDLKYSIILCHEPEGFCHRFIVRDWIETELGIIVPEWKRGDGCVG